MVMNPAHAIDEPEERFGARPPHGHMLPLGARLRDYEVTGLIDEGAFGIVYLAWDDSLQRKVAIKEFLPASLASRVAGSMAVAVHSDRFRDTFKAGLKSFVSEARLLARFDHASLVKVYRFWEENGTAYMVMPLYEGPTLKTALAELGHVPGEAELRTWLKPVLNAVALLHEGGVWHQNIAPEGILLTPVGPVLFGLGAAEKAIAALDHTPAAALKPGYAAIEQYGSAAETKRGPWTDLYALAAVIHTAITGTAPAAAADRLAEDTMRPLSVVAAGLYSTRFLAAVDAALAVEPERRPRDHLQFRSLMGDIDAPEPVELAPPPDLMHEPFLGARPGEREITVPDRPLLTLGEPAATKPGTGTSVPAVGAVKAAVSERAKSTARAGDGAPPRPAARSPSWLSTAVVSRLLGRRTVYGLVAGTCALIGIAALVLQFSARQSSHGVVATPAASAPGPIALTPPAATSTDTAVTTSPTGTIAAPPAALPVAAAAAPAVVPAPARAAAPAAPDDPASAPTVAGQQVRCTEILQKASLERITAAETSFYKRECK